ncbi:unnamed protein product [Acanthoscelides obtectus]|uniref:Uncharacterized protein n=1 Tax=Acanthoscelides obtectus TaxID=200917 RepID=A0A9P0JXF3_ACAOB|nr:unnamed protein product [Acanthoscelides obtectus]CAK1639109.1 hypothetical protein AOBTE_LOCUS11000 [Acanthoscelides obtectus]
MINMENNQDKEKPERQGDKADTSMDTYIEINNRQIMYSQKLREMNYEIMLMETKLIAAYCKYAEAVNTLKKTDNVLNL